MTVREKCGELVVLRCWCGIQHAVPESLHDLQLRQHNDGHRDVQGIYCPLGHVHVPAREPDYEKLRKILVAEKARHDQTRAELKFTEARRRAEKAAKTRIKNRVGNGVCPCCNRSFQNLRRHMDSKHPEFN